MHADLVAPSCFERQLDERSPCALREHAPVCHRVPRQVAARRAVDAVGIRLIEVRLERAALRRQLALDDRLVALLESVPRFLQRLLHQRGLRKDHQPRSLAVEAVDDPHALLRARIAEPQIFRELEIGRLLRLRLARDAQQARRLINHDEVRVLEEHLHPAAELRLRHREPVRAHRHDIALLQRMIELRHRPPVHRHRLEFQPRADLFFLLLRPLGKKCGKQR